jgi:hypothetical protein
MEIVYVLTSYDVNEEDGRECLISAGTDYEYLKNELLFNSTDDEENYYCINYYLSHEKIKGYLAKQEIYYCGKIKDVIKNNEELKLLGIEVSL